MKTYSSIGPLILALGVLCGCTTGPQSLVTDGPASFDGLLPVANTGSVDTWARPGFDVSGYQKIAFSGAGIHYRPVRGGGSRYLNRSDYPLKPADRERLEQIIVEEFTKELKQVDAYELAEGPGANTLLLTISIHDVVSKVPPADQSVDVYLSEVGAATLVLELRDSVTNTILARTKQRRAADKVEGFLESSSMTNWFDVRRLAAIWARQVRDGIQELGNG